MTIGTPCVSSEKYFMSVGGMHSVDAAVVSKYETFSNVVERMVTLPRLTKRALQTYGVV